MREYKFRGKRKDNGEWVYGCYTYSKKAERHLIWIQSEDNTEFWHTYPFEVYPSTVGQYTGLHDKNGKEGYEADILATPVGRAVIRFGEYSQPTGREKHIGFYLEFEYCEDDEAYRKDIGYWMHQSVIIGTLYDNPELLKEVE